MWICVFVHCRKGNTPWIVGRHEARGMTANGNDGCRIFSEPRKRNNMRRHRSGRFKRLINTLGEERGHFFSQGENAFDQELLEPAIRPLSGQAVSRAR
jgi:hypothetical protein